MIITTSLRPSSRTRSLCKELERVIPLSQYILRGKKGVRELISLSTEKGAERLLIITSKGDINTFVFYSGWNILGSVSASVVLRRELDIPKISPLREDVPFLLKSEEEDAERMAFLCGADIYEDSDVYTYMVYRKKVIDFYRLDFSEDPVGPQLRICGVNYEGYHCG